jgi:hypothetical protein
MALIGHKAIWASDPNVPVLTDSYNAGTLYRPVWVRVNAVYENRIRLRVWTNEDYWCDYSFTVYLVGY